MTYIKEQFNFARINHKFRGDAYGDFDAGLEEGFKIALKTYGIWKDGTQRIGAQEERVREIIVREFGEE